MRNTGVHSQLHHSDSLIDFDKSEAEHTLISTARFELEKLDLNPPAPFSDSDVSRAWNHVRVYRAADILEHEQLGSYAMEGFQARLDGLWRQSSFADFVRLTFDHLKEFNTVANPCSALVGECASNILELMSNADFVRVLKQERLLAFLILESLIKKAGESGHPLFQQSTALVRHQTTGHPSDTLDDGQNTSSATTTSGSSKIANQNGANALVHASFANSPDPSTAVPGHVSTTDYAKVTSELILLKQQLAKSQAEAAQSAQEVSDQHSLKVLHQSSTIKELRQRVAESEVNAKSVDTAATIPTLRKGRGSFTAVSSTLSQNEEADAKLRRELESLSLIHI